MQIPSMCSTRYAYSKLPIQRDGLDSLCDNYLKTESDNGHGKRSKIQRVIDLVRKGVNKLGNFMLNCIYIQPSGIEPLEYAFPYPYTYYALEGIAYW